MRDASGRLVRHPDQQICLGKIEGSLLRAQVQSVSEWVVRSLAEQEIKYTRPRVCGSFYSALAIKGIGLQ